MRWPLWIVWVLLLSGCVHRLDFGTWGLIEDPAEILAVLEERYRAVDGLVGEGRLSIDAPQGSGSLRMAVEVAKPGYVYLETADILGNPRGTFATDGDTFGFYQPQGDVFTTGPATAEIMGRFLPVALSPEELTSTLLGQIPILDTEDRRMSLDESSGTYVILLRQGRIQQRVVVGTKDLRLISVETRGAPAIDAFLEDHEEKLPGIPFATSIRLEVRRAETEVKIRYRDIRLNQAVDPGSFRLQAPPSARIERL